MAGLCLLAPEAHAQQIEGKVRFGLEAIVLDFSRATVSSDDGIPLAPSGSPTMAPDTIDEIDVTRTAFGLQGSSVGVVLGFGATDTVVAGARFSAGKQIVDYDFEGSESVESSFVSILPYVEYVVNSTDSSTDRMRPFVGLSLGLTHSEADGGLSTTQLLGGTNLGGHIFATDTFSVDPAVGLFVSSTNTTVQDVEFTGTGFTVLLSIGLSGWIATDRTPRTPTANAATVQPPTATSAEPVAAPDNADVAPEGPAPEAAPAPGPDLSRPLNVVLKMPDRSVIRLTADPRKSRTNANLQFARYGKPELECASMTVHGGTLDEPVANVVHKTSVIGTTPAEHLRGTVSVDALAALAIADDAKIIGCNSTWQLEPGHRADLGAFVDEVRARIAAMPQAAPAAKPPAAEAPAAEPPASGVDDTVPSSGGADAPAGDGADSK